MSEYILPYPKELLGLWRKGLVHRVWFWQYKGLFNQLDFDNADGPQHREGMHFGEWFTAIDFWTKGYKVLTEKYGLPGRKNSSTLMRILGPAGATFLTSGSVCRPDLMVYGPTYNLHSFVEVKRLREPLTDNQKKTFPIIETTLGCQILIVRLKPV